MYVFDICTHINICRKIRLSLQNVNNWNCRYWIYAHIDQTYSYTICISDMISTMV